MNYARFAKRSLPRVLITLSAFFQLSACSLIPDKHIHTEIDIAASPEVVWDILSDLERYPEWNPYHVRVDGRLEPGSILDLEIHKPNGEQVRLSPRIMCLNPFQCLSWGGGIPGIFQGEHVFKLLPLTENTTRLIHSEVFSGFAVPFASLDAIEEGYEQMNQALKTRAEASR